MPLTVGDDYHLTAGSKIAFDWTATGGPSLCAHASRLYLAFSGGGGLGGASANGDLNLAWSSDGLQWPQSQLTVYDQQHSLLSPALAELPALYGEPSRLFVSFTGTNHNLYLYDEQALARAQQVKANPIDPSPLKNAKDNDFETSDYAPALTAVLGPEGWSLIYVWTGSGNNRHLYSMDGLGYTANEAYHTAFSDTSAFAPAAITLDSHLYFAWAGTDNVHRLNVADYSGLQKIPS